VSYHRTVTVLGGWNTTFGATVVVSLTFSLFYSGGQQAALARGTTRRYRGTGVNANGRIERSTADDVEEESDEEDGRERLGFDRLRTVSQATVTENDTCQNTFKSHSSRCALVWSLASRNYDHPYIL